MKIKGKAYRQLIGIAHARFRVISPSGPLMDVSFAELYALREGVGIPESWIHGPVQFIVSDPYRVHACELGHETTVSGAHINAADMNVHYAQDHISPWPQMTLFEADDICSAYPWRSRGIAGVYPTCESGHPTRMNGTHVQPEHAVSHMPYGMRIQYGEETGNASTAQRREQSEASTKDCSPGS